MAQVHAQLQADNVVRQTAFEAAYLESVQLEHLAEMDELRVRLTTIDNNADVQTLSSPRPKIMATTPLCTKPW